MDVTAKISLGDPLEPARKATAQMLQERERTFSLPQPFYSDERLFDIDMQEIFQKEWLIAGMTCEIPTKGNYLTLQVGKNPIIVIRGAEGVVHAGAVGRGEGAAMLGHANRRGLDDSPAAKSWNSAHPSRGPDGGCSQNDLKSTGGDGLLYCFAVN